MASDNLPNVGCNCQSKPLVCAVMSTSQSPVQVGECDAAGWITLRIQFDDEDHACFVVLGHGPRAEVIEPASLRDRVTADMAAALLRACRAEPLGGMTGVAPR